MRISRIAAGLAATAAVAIGVAVIPAGAVTAPPTRPATIATNLGTLGLLTANGVTLGETGALSATVGGISLGGYPYPTVPNLTMSFATTKLSATKLALAGTLVFRRGAHIVTISNLKLSLNAAGTGGSVSGWIAATGFPAPTAAASAFYLHNVHVTVTSKYGHTWTTVTAVVQLPTGAVGTAVVGALTAYLGLGAPIFAPGTDIATAAAFVLRS